MSRTSMPDWSAWPEERRLLEGETVNQGVRRIVDAWKERDEWTSHVAPKTLREKHPEVFRGIDDDTLGTLCAPTWMYIGGAGSVNEAQFFAWWQRSLG